MQDNSFAIIFQFSSEDFQMAMRCIFIIGSCWWIKLQVVDAPCSNSAPPPHQIWYTSLRFYWCLVWRYYRIWNSQHTRMIRGGCSSGSSHLHHHEVVWSSHMNIFEKKKTIWGILILFLRLAANCDFRHYQYGLILHMYVFYLCHALIDVSLCKKSHCALQGVKLCYQLCFM